MQHLMDRIERFVSRRRKLVLAVWLILVVAAVPLASRQTENLTSGGYEAPGSGSQRVSAAIPNFPGVENEQLAVVLERKAGGTPALLAEIDRVNRVAAELPHAAVTDQVLTQAKEEAEGEEAVIVMPLQLSGTRDQIVDLAVDLREELGIENKKRRADVQSYVVGQQALWAGMQALSQEDLEEAEVIGLPLTLIVLLAVFGSLVAALLPLGLGVVAIILTGAGVFFLSRQLDMSVFVTNIASMLGIGVAIDYSLFVLSRYREEIHAGASEDEARHAAMRTSGMAVVFSGVTVLISLGGLFLIDSVTIRSLAVGAMLVVFIAILAAVFLLPALIGIMGRRAYTRGKVVGLVGRGLSKLSPRRGGDAGRPPFWDRWTATVTRRPVVFALLASAVLLALAVPALSLKTGNGALLQFPEDYETRVGTELAAQKLGPQANQPTQVVVSFRDTVTSGPNKEALDAYVAELGGLPGVAAVATPIASKDGRQALVNVVPQSDPESPEAARLLATLRSGDGPSATVMQAGARVDVGGPAAQNQDFEELIFGSLWKIFVFVMIFSYLVLMVLLRSILLPLKAVAMNLLTVAAAYGVLVMVFQYGWFDGVLNFDNLGYVNAITPPLLLAIVFGLSMDYEVFLLSRIKERYGATGNTQKAVAQGLSASAKTITSAALIMVIVFGVFALTGTPQVKEIGIGLAVAIALDATIVRLVLVPATMELMGGSNWWMPRFLAKRLPDVDFESSGAAQTPGRPEAEPELVGAER